MAHHRTSSLLSLLLCVCVCASQNAYEEEDVPNEYIIVMKKFSSLIKDRPIAEMIRDMVGCELLKEYKFKARRYAQLKFNNTEVLEMLQTNPLVELVEKNKKIKYIYPEKLDQKNLTDGTPGLSRKRRSASCEGRTLGVDGWGPTRIAYRELPNFRTAPYPYSTIDNGEGVNVYVVDSGIHIEHVDFEGRAKHGMVGSQLSGEGKDDLNGHGTHVAGISGGKRYGVAPAATLVNIKVLGEDGSGTTADIIEGVKWIVDDVAKLTGSRKRRVVVNMSLGGPGAVRSMEFAISSAIEEGIPVVIAAGNDFEDACRYTPARINEAITVGATDNADRLATFSNWGLCVDLLAPGVQIAAPYVDKSVLRGIRGPRNNIYQRLSGTSQACPHVAGAIARYLSSLSDDVLEKANPQTVMNLALDTSTKNRINIPRDAPGTPNKLLYKECAADMVDYNIFQMGDTDPGAPSSASARSIILFPVTISTFITMISRLLF